MPVRSDKRLWVRKLDGGLHVVAEQPQIRLYPESLAQLAESVERAIDPRPGGTAQARAAGSHWCISHGAVSRGVMIETATPVHEHDGDQTKPRLNEVLYDVVPGCLSAEARRFFLGQDVPSFNSAVKPSHSEIYLFHVEAGTRIHELYSRLDEGDGHIAESLARAVKNEGGAGDYSGPWALETMGGAGGQTIGGVVSTATHGGDQAFGAIGDAVVAIHLIDAKGEQHWIERSRLRPTTIPLQLTDPDKLRAVYPGIHYHPQADDLLDAALVSCGRMGVIYSLVLRVVRQYALKEQCQKLEWNAVKGRLGNPFDLIFWQNRFVRIDVNPYGGFWHPSKHECYVITRTLEALDAAGKPPLGRAERSGANAGKTSPPFDKGEGWFSNPCASDNWLRTVLVRMRHDFVEVRDAAIKVWLACAVVIIFPLTPPPLRAAALAAQNAAAGTIAVTQAIIIDLTMLIELIGPQKMPFGDTLAALANFCAEFGYFALFRMIYEKTAESQHHSDPTDQKPPAISYAMMDEHDYLNVGCVAPGDSIEFFMDADSPGLPDFIDHVLARVRDLENGTLSNGSPQVFGGYISLRFMTRSDAPLATQRWQRTCSIEIAGLSKVRGTEPLLRTLEEDARNYDILLHWGQRNNLTMDDVEKRFGFLPGSAMFKWRQALSDLTEHGRHAVFSTDFTRRKGLEITDPIVQAFSVKPTDACAHEPVTVSWDAIANPPETEAFLVHRQADGTVRRIELSSLEGSRQIALGDGRSELTLMLVRELNGRRYTAQRSLEARGFAAGGVWSFVLAAEPRTIGGVARWAVEINLFSQFISNALKAAKLRATFGPVSAWRVRNPEVGELAMTSAQAEVTFSSEPTFNTNWLLFSEAAATGPAPMVELHFTLTCEH